MARIFHMADMHLDSSFTTRLSAEMAQVRRSEQRYVFSKIIDIARDSADVLLISGDLFDSSNVSKDTISFLKRKFTEIPNIHVFIAAGNHDPYTDSSVYANNYFGSNVRVFGHDGEYFDLDDLHIRICGASFASEDGSSVQSICDMPKNDEYDNIAVIHGDVVRGGSGGGRYNPISLKEIEESGFDYVALGHVHTYSGFNKAGRTVWAYPGIPEPRGFDECSENGRFGVIYIDTENGFGESNFKFIEVCERQYHVLEVEFDESVNDSEMIIERISERLSAFAECDLFKIIVSGQIAEGFRPNIEMISERIKGSAFLVTVEDKTKTIRNLNIAENDNSLRAAYIRMLRQRIENADTEEERQIAEEALKLGVDAIDGQLR